MTHHVGGQKRDFQTVEDCLTSYPFSSSYEKMCPSRTREYTCKDDHTASWKRVQREKRREPQSDTAREAPQEACRALMSVSLKSTCRSTLNVMVAGGRAFGRWLS